MTRPRSQQIDNLKTRHSRFTYVPTPEAAQDVIAEATVFAATVSDVPGGAETDVFAAFETPTPGPFPIAAGDAFSVALDGSPPVNVVLASTDTTASRIAAKVIAAVGGNNAAASEGILTIFSLTPGSAGSVALADVVGGTLAKLGLTAGTVTGADAPVRGVITRSSDGRGGRVLLRTTDGQDLVTDASSLVLLGEGLLPPLRTVEKPGGIPVHARLKWAGGNFTLRYFASLPTRPEVETFNSSLNLLDGTDTFDITVTDPSTGLSAGPMTVTFPSGPGLTRDQVVTRINDLWADFNTISNDGQAHVSGTMTGPFTWAGLGDTVEVSVDGGPFQAVSFLSSDVSATDVASRFNGAVTGATASVNSDGTVRFESDNSDGTVSSLEFRSSGASYALCSFFGNLGIQPGRYRGYFIAQPSGPSEIRLFGIGRGVQATLTIASANPTTLARMGLTATTHTGQDDGEEAVRFPVQDPNTPATGHRIVALIPEVMDFGEVPTSEESDLARFENKSSGSARIQGVKNQYIDQVQTFGLGILDSGKPAVAGPDGSIPPTAFGRARAEYENFFKQFIRGDFSARTVDALVASVIETPGTAGNPGLQDSTFTVDVDPGDFFTTRQFVVRIGRDGSSFTPFAVTGVPTPLSGVNVFVGAEDSGGLLSAFSNSAGPLRLHDANVQASGSATAGLQVIPLTSSTAGEGDRTLRIMDREEGNTEPVSLFRQVNGRWTTTCGDGTNSFGDFNGTDAIQQAISFYNANIGPGAGLTIQLKRGIFLVNPTNGLISTPGVSTFIIEGQGRQATTISMDVVQTPAIQVFQSNVRLVLRDLTLIGSAGDFEITMVGTTGNVLEAQDVRFDRAAVRALGSESVRLVRCQFAGASLTQPCVLLQSGSQAEVGPFTFEDCEFFSGQSNPVLRIRSGLTNLVALGPVTFDRCRMRLLSTTLDGNSNMVGNCGVLDIDPNGFDSLNGFQGAFVTDVLFRDCDVRANHNGAGTVSVLLHVMPAANGAFNNGTPWVEGNPAIRIDRFAIRGGRWIVPSQDTQLNPVSIGLAWSATGASDFNDYNSGMVDVREAVFGFDQTGISGRQHGLCSQDIGSFFTDPAFGGPQVPVGIWGAFAFAGNYLTLKDLKFVGMGQLSQSGDLFIKADKVLDVDGVHLFDYKIGGPSTAPSNRVRIRLGSLASQGRATKHTVRNLTLRGTNASASTWGTAIAVEPVSGPPTLLDQIHVSNFTVLAARTDVGIVLVDAAFGGLYNNSGSVFDRLDMSRLTLRDCTSGVLGSIFSSILRQWSVVDSEMTACNDAISVTTGGRIGSVQICRNRVYQCGLVPVYLGAAEWNTTSATDPANVVMNDNIFRNNVSAGSVQAQIEATAVAGNHQPRGSVIGNSFGSDSTLEGFFQTNRVVGGVNSALASPANPGTIRCIRGIETGHSLADANQLLYDALDGMHRNQGFLTTP